MICHKKLWFIQLSITQFFRPKRHLDKTAINKIYKYNFLMNAESPYCVTTNSGKLQLTKGAYLTLMKRKSSICKTLQKSKSINQSYKYNNKKTIKKNYNEWKQKIHSVNSETIQMITRRNGQFMTKSFAVKQDRQIFNYPPIIPNVPVIQMEMDNDCESQWPEIEECVENMRISLSLAMYDYQANKIQAL